MKSKKEVLIIAIIFFVVLTISFTMVFNKKSYAQGETGHFYRTPSSIDDIDHINITYNNGKDYIAISSDNLINYYTFTYKGDMVDNIKKIKTKKIIEYVYKNDLKYLTDFDKDDNAKWVLSIYSPGGHCLINGKGKEPRWFKRLLKKLKANKNGYLYKKYKNKK